MDFKSFYILLMELTLDFIQEIIHNIYTDGQVLTFLQKSRFFVLLINFPISCDNVRFIFFFQISTKFKSSQPNLSIDYKIWNYAKNKFSIYLNKVGGNLSMKILSNFTDHFWLAFNVKYQKFCLAGLKFRECWGNVSGAGQCLSNIELQFIFL